VIAPALNKAGFPCEVIVDESLPLIGLADAYVAKPKMTWVYGNEGFIKEIIGAGRGS
jgi:hypothetical protein